MKNAEYIKELEESMYIDGVLLDWERLEQVRIYVRDNNITDYIIPDEEIIPRHLAADDIRDLIQVAD